MKRKIIIIGILMGILLSFIQWPIPFERSFQCVDYTIGESDSQTVNVSIQGTHYYSVLRTNYLKYTIYTRINYEFGYTGYMREEKYSKK